jgi:hypothetical protein
MNNLKFFDKEGKSLNFTYNDDIARYDGDVLFHENSTDTFKTQALYMFEKIDAFDYECENNLSLQKWQLFNEFGFHFYKSSEAGEVITLIEPVNYESDYYSKWIYGEDFHKKFPIGTLIRFEDNIFGFNDPNRLYFVIRSRPGSIMILSDDTNYFFENTYPYQNTASYTGQSISSVDVIGVYNYITPTLQNTLSSWNEDEFYNEISVGRKINIVNTDLNDDYKTTNDYDDVDVVTIKNDSVLDMTHYEYSVLDSQLPTNTGLVIEVITRTDVPLVYEGSLQFYDGSTPNPLGYTGVIDFVSGVPQILKPGVEFKIPESTFNQQFYLVSPITQFLGNANMVTYQVGQQVIWENKIYQCVQSYTWVANSISEDLTAIPPVTTATPDNTDYWGSATYLAVDQTPINETVGVTGKVYLTTDNLSYTQNFTFSETVTLSSAAETYTEVFSELDIDLYYENSKLKANLRHPSKYALVNFLTDTTPQINIGSTENVIERLIEVEEQLVSEYNYDISENFDYNIVFTDLDDYGFIIKINGEIYQVDIQFVYSSGQVDMERTINATLVEWYNRNLSELVSLGVLPTLQTIGFISPYKNSIKLKTQYPNIPMEFDVSVGSTADFYIEHTEVTFHEPSIEGVTFSFSPYLDIVVNDRSYPVTHSLPVGSVSSMPSTLDNWIDQYQFILDDYGVYVSNAGTTLKFDVKDPSQRCDIDIKPGASVLPGDYNYVVTEKFSGNHGSLLTSNSVILGTPSGTQSSTFSCLHFEDTGFATGMISGVNNTFYTLQNVDYSIIFLDPYVMNLSYEGPFWGLTQGCYGNSPFTMIGFSNGFQQSGCVSVTQSSGMFNNQQFSSAYSITFQNTATYSINVYSATQSAVDLLYVQPSSSMFVLGDDLLVYDSVNGNLDTQVPLSGTYSPLKLLFNTFDSYVYALEERNLYWVDPYTQNLVGQLVIPNTAFSMEFNSDNGDVYVTTDTALLIYNSGVLVQTITGQGYSLAFNSFEGDMYVVSPPTDIKRIDGPTRTLVNTYTVPAVTDDDILYDPVNESIYLHDATNMYVIDNNAINVTTLTSGTNNYLEFSGIDDSIYISSDNPRFAKRDADTGNLHYNNILPPAYGYQSMNYYDGDLYISNQDPLSPNISVMNSITGIVREIFPLPIGDNVTRNEFDPDRNSVWFLQPTLSQIIEIVPQVSFVISSTNVQNPLTVTQSQYGTLDPNYTQPSGLWLNTRDYLRRPRYNFNGGITASLYWKWYSDNVPEFFLYDFSGDQLTTDGPLAYIGEKPLPTVHLNSKPNRDISEVSNPIQQQTIFPLIEHTLDFIDDDDDISSTPQPIETFMGFRSREEGALRSILQLYIKEDVDFTIDTSLDITNEISFSTDVNTVSGERTGKIQLATQSTTMFVDRGLAVGQNIAIFLNDVTNSSGQYISSNNGYLVKIKGVYAREIEVEFFKEIDYFIGESTIVNDFPSNGGLTYLSLRIKVWDRELGRFLTYGQTENEDIRFKTELSNIGKLVSPDDVYIFKPYDIKEEGIDWTYLNKKRKEMLMMRHLIYPYVGSYRAIINAINYFGYNDLELYEYYKNVDRLSENYMKLYKVEIPDIFDQSVVGWEDNDFLKGTFPNDKYDDTRLFNLTYRITDREGNSLLTYTIEEVQKKLQGLKYWLQGNVIPLSHKILDITGRTDFLQENFISHQVKDVQTFNVHQSMTPVSFRMNEAYLMPVNNGSTVYNCVLDLYADQPNGVTQSLPDEYTIDIRTYEIYREWYSLKTYSAGEKVVYYDKAYESTINDNRMNNPRKYEDVSEWKSGTTYNVSDIVSYDRDHYIFSGYGMTPSATASTVSPAIDNGGQFTNWIDITEWKEIDIHPIQRITERRRISTLDPFNFTVDSNIDPYIVVEVNSNNGYGLSYRDKKNFEIKGILDIQELEAFANLTSKQYRDATLGTNVIS